jgi:hypothetical protein
MKKCSCSILNILLMFLFVEAITNTPKQKTKTTTQIPVNEKPTFTSDLFRIYLDPPS